MALHLSLQAQKEDSPLGFFRRNPRDQVPEDLGLELARHLAGRFHRVLVEVRMQEIAPNWISVTSSGLRFRALSLREADRFVRNFENLVRGPDDGAPRSCPPDWNQLRLF